MSIVMSEEECREFLAGVHVGVISIPDGERGPLTCPVWYQYEKGGDVFIVTPADSRKGRLMKPGVRVSFCVQQEEMLPKYVSIEGPVVSVEKAVVDSDVKPLAARYLGREIGDRYVEATRSGDSAPDEVVIRIHPERWLSADFAKRVPQG